MFEFLMIQQKKDDKLLSRIAICLHLSTINIDEHFFTSKQIVPIANNVRFLGTHNAST